jgi:hypothetical protein
LAEIKPLVCADHDVLARAASLLGFITPNSVKDFRVAQSFADVDAFNNDNQSKKRATAHGTEKNSNTPDQQQDTVGDCPKQDWYTDAVFSQQQFAGTNPTTVRLAPQWTTESVTTAKDQGNGAAVNFLSGPNASSLYIQDCSYFRQAMGLKFDEAHGPT